VSAEKVVQATLEFEEIGMISGIRGQLGERGLQEQNSVL